MSERTEGQILPKKRIISREPKLVSMVEEVMPIVVEERSPPRKTALQISKEVAKNLRDPDFQADTISYGLAQISINAISQTIQPVVSEILSRRFKRK